MGKEDVKVDLNAFAKETLVRNYNTYYKQKLSNKNLAKKMGVGNMTVWRVLYKKDHPVTMDFIQRYCEATDQSVYRFMENILDTFIFHTRQIDEKKKDPELIMRLMK